MSEHFTFYTQTCDLLPEGALTELAQKLQANLSAMDEPNGRTYFFDWPGLKITCEQLRFQDLEQHLVGFRRAVQGILGRAPNERDENLLKRISQTRLAVGVIIEPGRAAGKQCQELLESFGTGLQAMMFHVGAIYDQESRLILGPDRSFDEEADVVGPAASMRSALTTDDLPEADRPPVSPAQLARYERIVDIVREKQLPTLSFPLVVEDESTLRLRSARDVAQRVLVLSAVTSLAEGGSSDAANALIDRYRDLNEAVTPDEIEFLQAAKPDPAQARRLIWRLEGLWLLAWSLGDLELEWPYGLCDVKRLFALCAEYAERPDFIETARLRPAAEILDAKQETTLIQWAIRNAWLTREDIPINLDWSDDRERVPEQQSPAVGVVAERMHALNWLTCYKDAEWDDVETPT